MREYNCDGLKNMKVADALIEKALAVPAAVGAAKATVRPLRRLVAAAAVFLVGVVSVSIYFFIRNIDDAPLVAAPAAQTIASPMDATVPPTDVPTEVIITAPTEPDATAAPTDAPTVSSEPPTAAPTQSEPADPEPPRPVETVPPVTPSVPVTEPPTDPPVIPTEEPTEPPEPPAPTDPVVPQTNKEIASVGYMVPISSYTDSDDLYCRLYSSSGLLIGDDDLYNESHRVYFTTGSGYLFLSYPLGSLVEPLPPDHYTIVFYDADGSDFYICSAFLSRR